MGKIKRADLDLIRCFAIIFVILAMYLGLYLMIPFLNEFIASKNGGYCPKTKMNVHRN